MKINIKYNGRRMTLLDEGSNFLKLKQEIGNYFNILPGYFLNEILKFE